MQEMFGLSKFNVRNVSFDAIVAGSVTNYDLALPGFHHARAQVVSFSQPYFESQQGVLMRAGDTMSTLAEGRPPTGASRLPPPPSTS
jgi:hypothetical protein